MRDTKIAQHARYFASDLIVPIMKRTGFRFQKSSRGHWINIFVERVYANLKADGFKPDRLVW